jgi:hypothetical protein
VIADRTLSLASTFNPAKPLRRNESQLLLL